MTNIQVLNFLDFYTVSYLVFKITIAVQISIYDRGTANIYEYLRNWLTF